MEMSDEPDSEGDGGNATGSLTACFLPTQLHSVVPRHCRAAPPARTRPQHSVARSRGPARHPRKGHVVHMRPPRPLFRVSRLVLTIESLQPPQLDCFVRRPHDASTTRVRRSRGGHHQHPSPTATSSNTPSHRSCHRCPRTSDCAGATGVRSSWSGSAARTSIYKPKRPRSRPLKRLTWMTDFDRQVTTSFHLPGMPFHAPLRAAPWNT